MKSYFLPSIAKPVYFEIHKPLRQCTFFALVAPTGRRSIMFCSRPIPRLYQDFMFISPFLTAVLQPYYTINSVFVNTKENAAEQTPFRALGCRAHSLPCRECGGQSGVSHRTRQARAASGACAAAAAIDFAGMRLRPIRRNRLARRVPDLFSGVPVEL